MLHLFRCTCASAYPVGTEHGAGHAVRNAEQPVAELNHGLDMQTVLDRYGDEIRRCRYGSFRGVIKDGRVVIFAVEHEWRPQLEAQRAETEGTQRKQA